MRVVAVLEKERVQLVCAVFFIIRSLFLFLLVFFLGELSGESVSVLAWLGLVGFGLGLGWCWGYYWLGGELGRFPVFYIPIPLPLSLFLSLDDTISCIWMPFPLSLSLLSLAPHTPTTHPTYHQTFYLSTYLSLLFFKHVLRPYGLFSCLWRWFETTVEEKLDVLKVA